MALTLTLTLTVLLTLTLLVMETRGYPSEQIQKWHKTLYDTLYQRNRLGQLASMPFCKNDLETLRSVDNITEADYLKHLRTVNGSVLTVNFDVSVSQVVEVNERQRVLTLKLLVTMCWTDCRLTWNLRDFPIEQIRISNQYLRKMDMYIPHITMLEELDRPVSDHIEYIAEIWSNYIVLSKRYTTTVSCNIDVSMYPLDIQFCNLTFESVLERTMVSLTSGEVYHEGQHREKSRQQPMETLRSNLGRYMPNDAWEVHLLRGYQYAQNSCLEYEDESASYCTLTDTVTHTLLLRRHPTYQLVSLMFPAFLIVVISGCVFLIPPGSSDKMSLSLSSMLSLFIFTNIMYDKMPETGETLPLLSQYFLSSVALVGLSCVASSLSVIFEESDETARVKQLATRKNNNNNNKNKNNGNGNGNNIDPESCPTETTGTATESSNEPVGGLRRLARIFDRIFFVFYLLASVFILMMYIVRGYIPWKHYGYRAIEL